MITLGIDTSEREGGVALYSEGGISEEVLFEGPLRHAESLFPAIDRLLKRAGLDKGEIELVSVNQGPGSFTGLRIGLAGAKGLCQGLHIPLVGVDGTLSYRSRLPDAERVCVIITSRRDLVYARWFAGERAKGATRLLHEEELIGMLSKEGREMTLVGSGAPRVYARVKENRALRIAPERLNQPSPLAIARLGAGDGRLDRLFQLEPTYVESILA